MIFLTNQDKVSNSAWGYIWGAKETNQKWKFFIIDLDLLSLLLYHLKIEASLFNLSSPSPPSP